jgi:CBS domain-containing protein
MNAADIMSREVLAIDAEAPLAQAVRLMTEHRVSGLPVLDRAGRLVGVLTEGDLLRRAEIGTDGDPPGWIASLLFPGREAGAYVRTHGRRVEEIMTDTPVTVTEDTPLAELVRLMQRHRVKRLPVLREGRLVGVVSRADLIRKLGEALAGPPASADDAAIEQAITEQMKREPWAPGRLITVSARAGVVGLDGVLFDIRARDAVGVLAENTPGVTRVENRIVCIDPNVGLIAYDPQLELGTP